MNEDYEDCMFNNNGICDIADDQFNGCEGYTPESEVKSE